MRRVLITCPQMQRYADDYLETLAALEITADLPPVVQQLNEKELIEIIHRYHGVIAGDDHFTARVIARATLLKVISKWGVGIDNIDLDAARARGIRVTNTPGVFADEVSDVVIGYLVLLARGLHRIDAAVRRGDWPKIEGTSLAGKTLGIVGLGSIGQAVARRAQAMGVRVIGFDISAAHSQAAEALGIETAPVDQLLRHVDFLSLNCSLTEANRHMLGEAELQSMKRGAFLINTARGALIDEEALVRAIAGGQIAAAALDVFEEEPLPSGSVLRQFQQVILGAHNSSNTREAAARVSNLAIENLIDGLRAES